MAHMSKTTPLLKSIAVNITPLIAGNASCPAAIVVDVSGDADGAHRDDAHSLPLYRRLRRVGMSPEEESVVFFLYFWDAEAAKFRLLIGVPSLL